MAGLLGVRLGGTNKYAGEVIDSPHLEANSRCQTARMRGEHGRLSVWLLCLALAESVAYVGEET